MSDPAWVNAGKSATALGTATIASATNLLTITSHGLGDGDTVTVDTLTGGGSALTADAVYFVRDATTDDLALSLTLHGPQVEFATDGGADVYSWSPQYSAAQLRRLHAGLMFGGTSDAFGARQGVRPGHVPLSVSGTTWTVEDLTGAVYPGLSSDDGGYPVAHQEESGSLDPADGSNDRIDALDLQIQDDDEDASGFRRARVVYVTGTPAADPSAPAVTSNALRLGTILVPSGGSPSPSIATLAQFTVASGGVLPVADSSGLPTSGRYHGMMAYDQDADALLAWDGTSAWPAVASPSSPTMVVMESSGTFDKGDYPWGRKARVRLKGGGGSGGGTAATTGAESAEAGGGGSGGYSEKIIDFADLSSSETVTIGSGGTAASAGGAGNQGGTTSFGTHCSAAGGTGGGAGPASDGNGTAEGGEGGSASDGDINIIGDDGGVGRVISGNTTVMGGWGGGGMLGGQTCNDIGSTNGVAGQGYGGGSAGARANTAGQSARPSNPGNDGVCIIEVF